jgi:hypothetical protein
MHVKFFVDMGATQLTVFMAPVASGDSHLLMGALLGASMEYQDFIALKINLLWWQCGGNVVAMWWQCGGNVVAMCGYTAHQFRKKFPVNQLERYRPWRGHRPSTLKPQTGFPRSSSTVVARRLNAPVFKIVVDSRPPFESEPRQITKFLLPSCRAHFLAVCFIDERKEHGKWTIYI